LIKELLTETATKAVCSYLIGIATPADYFETIKVSETASIGGFVTWNTFLRISRLIIMTV
jgi:hypothetical protein